MTSSNLEETINLDSISLKSKFINEAVEKENVAAQKIYNAFIADSNYKMNACWTLGEIITNGTLSTRKYMRKGKTLRINYKDKDLEKEI